MKRRIAAGLLTIALTLSMSVTSLAADLPQAPVGQTQEETGAEETPGAPVLDETEDGEPENYPGGGITDTETPEAEREESEDAELTETPDADEETEETEETETSTEELESAVSAQNEAGETVTEWTAEDFTYTEMSQTLNGCDYTREFTISGIAVSGFSESGEAKLENCKDLVIPSKDPNGTTIVGVADRAFYKRGIQSLKLPEGMMVDYDDTVTNVVTRRGNFLIGASAFYGNELTSLVLPEGVIFIGSSSFARNNLSYVKIPHTFWWLENSAFAYNNLSSVDFPETCDFQAQIHALAFAQNNIKSVRLPDYMEVVDKRTFYFNPGMEECPADAPENEQGFGGVVYMYTDNAALFDMERIHHIDRTAESQKSWHQKLILGTNPDSQETWTTADFTYEGTVVTGLSESGIEKRATNPHLVIPSKNENGEWITEIAGSTMNTYGTFATEEEGFETVTLPSHLEKIGDRVFAANGLTTVEFPNTLKEIGIAAFQMNSLVAINLPDSLTVLGGGAFGSNPTIETVHISKGLTEIPAGAFGCSDAQNYMTKFTEVTIPEGIISIGSRAFAGNNFSEITIPASVKSIGEYAFSTKEYLTGDTTLNLSEGLETIGNRAFRNKTIKEVTLPQSVTGLPKQVFEKVYSSGAEAVVTKVYVSSEEQYNDSKNFPKSDYHRLVLKTPETEREWNAEDFTYGTIEETLSPAHDTEAKVTIQGTGITGFSEDGEKKLEVNPNVVIPSEDYNGNQIVGIAQKAFYKKGLTSVTFPSGVMADHEGEHIAEGVTRRGNFIIQASAFLGNNLTEVDLPEGVIYVGSSAFNGNQITRVSMSHTIWQIGMSAFYNNAITSVEFPETCDFKLNIDNMAFAKNQIQAVRLPDRTEKVTWYVFQENTGMEEVEDSSGVPSAAKKGGVVYMYNENVNLAAEESLIYHVDGTGTGTSASGNKSWVQKFIHEKMPEDLRPWSAVHFTFDGGTVTGLSETGKAKLAAGDTAPVIPSETPDGEAVTAIGANAFATAEMTEITIPDSVTQIGLAAFRATKLTKVVLPDSITSLGSGAFTNCADLAELTLSKGLTEIPQAAFNYNSLKEVVIPEGVTTIGENAFRNAPITSLTLPETVTKIDKRAFAGNQLGELEIPASVATIGQSAFSQNVEGEGLAPRLEKLTLHEGLKEIGKQAFEKTLLTSVEIPASLTGLTATSFQDGQNGQVILFTSSKEQLEETEDFIPEAAGHKVVYDQVVGSGWSHADFTFDGSTVTGWSAQGNQTRLTNHNLVIPSVNPETLEPVTAVGASAFEIPDGEWIQGKDGVESPNGMETVAFPDTLVTIGEEAFRYNSLTTLDFPASLTTIMTSAFNSNKLEKVVLPDTVTEVQEGAFSTNNITELTLSKSLTVLPQGVFSMNINLSQVEIPEGIVEIGDMAFAGARLETLEIPSSVTKIGRKAFHLHHLTELTIPGTVKEIGDSAFEGTFKAITLKNLVLEEGIETIGSYAFKEGYLETVQLPSSLTSLAKDAFYGNAGTDNDHVVKLYTSNVAHMAWEMDETCQKLIFNAQWDTDCFTYDGTTVTGFSDKGLEYLNYTKDVVIPDTTPDGAYVTGIGQGAFKGYGLTSVVLPAHLETIAEEAFLENNLTKVELPESVKEVADNAFDSTVEVVEKKPEDIPGGGEQGGQTGGNQTGGSQTDGNKTNTSTAGGSKAADTGDTAPILPAAAALAVSGAVIAAVLRKKRQA